ncbi:unnamed protein product [Ostreobium quekettii]|uniref:Uncharacterized protein n=1 Tax=Ostreobium quekettii TaxID=121088 RepID=A0A8S1J6S1_9CHLO|nr:unnamed protein product [Ostreobium quekettii]
MKPSIVIAKQRRLSRDTPSPRKQTSQRSSYSELTEDLGDESDTGSTPLCPGSFSRFTGSPTPLLSPSMTTSEGRWSPSSLSDADSTTASSEPELPAPEAVDGPGLPAILPRVGRKRNNQGLERSMSAIEARLQEIRAPVGKCGPIHGRDCSPGRPGGYMPGRGPAGGGAAASLTVRTGREEDRQKVTPRAKPGEGFHGLLDTAGTLSPVPSDLFLARSESTVQDEDGLTLFVNPMVFCETVEDDVREAAAKGEEGAKAEEAVGLIAGGKADSPSNRMNKKLRKVQAKMGQVFPVDASEHSKERTSSPAIMVDSEEESGVAQGASSSSSVEWRANSISIEERVAALKSGHSDAPVPVAPVAQNVRLAEGWTPSWASNGIGHFREDSTWGSKTEQTCCNPFRQAAWKSNIAFQFRGNVDSPTTQATKAARRRTFLKSCSRIAARQGQDGSWSPTALWVDEQSLDAAVDRAFQNVEPITLVRKGSSQAESLRSLTRTRSTGSWRTAPSVTTLRSRALWSDEAPSVVSQLQSQCSSSGRGWQRKTQPLTKIDEDAELSRRDRLWGGLSIGVLSLLSLFL